jgi:hypothetical protein
VECELTRTAFETNGTETNGTEDICGCEQSYGDIDYVDVGTWMEEEPTPDESCFKEVNIMVIINILRKASAQFSCFVGESDIIMVASEDACLTLFHLKFIVDRRGVPAGNNFPSQAWCSYPRIGSPFRVMR